MVDTQVTGMLPTTLPAPLQFPSQHPHWLVDPRCNPASSSSPKAQTTSSASSPGDQPDLHHHHSHHHPHCRHLDPDVAQIPLVRVPSPFIIFTTIITTTIIIILIVDIFMFRCGANPLGPGPFPIPLPGINDGPECQPTK